MELDVCLKRAGDEPWGFRLIGGVDFGMPLTVAKVVPDSPAELFGLQNGDAVVSVQGADASTMTHEDSKVALSGAGDTLRLGVVRGLYDPVLDEYDPIYEPIDQEDFDQSSQPTEVPDYLDLSLTLPQFADTVPDANGIVKPNAINSQDPRSLTASPFVAPTKPYRPFSTEPVPEIPALEDPIILNPAFQDVFGSLKDLEEFLPKTRFKLPISEQYDPDGTKQKMKLEAFKNKDVTSTDLVSKTVEDKVIVINDFEIKEKMDFVKAKDDKMVALISKNTKEATMIKEDFEMKEQTITKQKEIKTEIDLKSIEKKATSIVDESIEKAMKVAEVIKKEIDIELSESSDSETSKTNFINESSMKKSKSSKITSALQKEVSTIESKETDVKDVTLLADITVNTTEQILKQNDHKTGINICHDVSEVVDTKKSETKVSNIENNISEQTECKVFITNKEDVQRKVSVNELKSETVDYREIHDSTQSQAATKDSKSETKYSTSKLLAEQRAYTLGLQTIPNIRGTTHSSYHYDLLLKTFFIHLTDVMVALSRLILAEPILSKPVKQETQTEVSQNYAGREEIISKSISVTDDKIAKDVASKKQDVSQAVVLTNKDCTVSRIVTPEKKERVVGKILQKAQEIKHQDKHKTGNYEENRADVIRVEEKIRSEEIVKKRDISGSRMAQLTEKKPEELMQNMENVLTEFESKSCNEDIEIVRERRSRSRSTVVTPVDIIDKHSQGIIENSSFTTNAMSCRSESKTSESGYESTACVTVDGEKTYIAIVQSHVYTNKDAIFEATEVSNEIKEKVTKEVVKNAISNEIDIKSLEKTEKAVEAIDKTSKKIVSAEKENQSLISENSQTKSREIVEDVQKTIEETVQNNLKCVEKLTDKVEKVQDVIIQEITEPIVEEFKSTFNQNYTVIEAKEETDSSKSEFSNKQEIIIEEIDDSKEKSTSISNYIVSEAKTEICTVEEDNQASNVVYSKQEAISSVTSIGEAPIITKDVLPVQSIKAESLVSKEKDSEVKQESTLVKDESKVSTYAIKKKGREVSNTSSTKSILKNVDRKEIDKSAALKISNEQHTEKKSAFVGMDDKINISLTTVDNYEDIKHIESKNVEQETTFIAKSANRESTFTAQSIETKINESTNIKSSSVTESVEHVESKQIQQESIFVAKSVNLESNLSATSVDKKEIKIQESSSSTNFVYDKKSLKLPLDTNYAHKKTESLLSDDGDLLKTPTPSTVPPTPLTDEYVFKLVAKLPKREGLPPIPRDCTPSDDEDEDPHIVKKGLIPHIEANVGDQQIFNPPLPTPLTSPTSPTSPKALGLKGGAPVIPRYFKPGLRGGAPPVSLFYKTPVKPDLKGDADEKTNQEDIKEIELKSSLLASAIDETIKSIEEYKEEVGIKKCSPESLKESAEPVYNGVIYNGYSKVVETNVFENIASNNSNKQDTKVVNKNKTTENFNGVIDPNFKDEQAQIMTNGFSKKVFQTEPKSKFLQENEVLGSPMDDAGKNSEIKPIQITALKNGLQTPVENGDIKPDFAKSQAVIIEEKRNPMEGYKPVPFDPEELNAQRERRAALGIKIPYLTPSQERELYKTSSGEVIGTHQGIVDGLEEAIVDSDVAKDLGKPGITEEKIAELISGEAEMLREAHVMGLSRVLRSHMQRDGDDSSVDFNKIKPIVESLKDSEVLKALNEELLRDAEERKKKEANKDSWTTFMQKPKRPVPKSKHGYYKDTSEEEEKVIPIKKIPYKPKIVKQPKPKVAPDYKPKDFNTGLLPWEERALKEPTPPPVEPEDPILIPEEAPEILEAVDPLPESEVPDLEDSGIPLPPPPEPKEPTPPPEEATEDATEEEELDLEAVLEETEKIVEDNLVKEMEGGNIAEQLMTSVQNMVDPNAPLEQQLAAMRAQLAALAQLPGVIQQSLEMVTRQLAMLGQAGATQQQPAIEEMPEADMTPAAVEETEVSENGGTTIEEISQEEETGLEPVEQPAPTLTPEEVERMRREEEQMLEDQKKMEKQKKELMEQARIEHESRQLKQRPTPRVGNPLPDPRVGKPQAEPRVGKPQPVFGPAVPAERPVVLPGGRKWRTPKDAYNDAFIAETLQSQAELIAGKTMGLSYESVLLPYDHRVNFMKYEKPPVSLDHLKDSDTYKLIHNMEMSQPKRVEMLTPVIAEADYREKCRSMTPCTERLAQQVQP